MGALRQKRRVRQSRFQLVRLHRRPLDLSPPSPEGIKMSPNFHDRHIPLTLAPP